MSTPGMSNVKPEGLQLDRGYIFLSLFLSLAQSVLHIIQPCQLWAQPINIVVWFRMDYSENSQVLVSQGQNWEEHAQQITYGLIQLIGTV